MSLNLNELRTANEARQKLWDPNNQITPSYRGNELAGEVGEACNVIKKLERERLGIKGSRDTVEHLAQELADVVICTELIALKYGIDLSTAVIDKFNATSDAVGFPIKLGEPSDKEMLMHEFERCCIGCDSCKICGIVGWDHE